MSDTRARRILHVLRQLHGARLRQRLVMIAAAVASIALSASSLSAAAAPAAPAAGASDGKAIFLAQKCNLCHSISAAGIDSMVKAPAMRGPDLGGVVAEKGAAWATSFLKHQVNLDGKPHKKEWTASDEDLKALVGWLSEQKKAAQ
jgi:mono/diheme cytochrome c family protein